MPDSAKSTESTEPPESPLSCPDPQAWRGAALLHRFRRVRAETMRLVGHLSVEDCSVQVMPDASPVKWHLAHTTWFFETFLLERFEAGFRAHHPAFKMLFNSYYTGVGDRHARAHRGVLTRPSHAEVLTYRANVDERVAVLLRQSCEARSSLAEAEITELLELGLQHEQQHQELIMTDIMYLLSMNPLQPAYDQHMPRARATRSPLAWVRFNAGIVAIGHPGPGFSFDSETPRHRQFVESFALGSRLVTNREFLAFIEAGGYRDPLLWLSEGWDWLCANALQHPLYWRPSANCGDWREFTLSGLRCLEPDAAVSHVSMYEADAYARWAGARLPTEAEWECAAGSIADSVDGGANNAGTDRLTQLFDTCWQWTSSSYTAYPGYTSAPGALGEYNGKFMINQYVLRGGSCVTPTGHTRASYRNFFPASARWQFSGIRLARPDSDEA